jgi:beta-N-acetylhexosaminidase
MRTIQSAVFAFLFITLTSFVSHRDSITKQPGEDPIYQAAKGVWADSVLSSLQLEEKIAQLFVVAAYSNLGPSHQADLEHLIQQYNVGGLLFMQGGPVRQANLTNRYQSLAKTPLMVSMDAEWGLGMRLDSTIRYPYQMTLGAIQDDALVYDMGAEIAKQLKRIGVHVNLGPVVDVNNNRENPVINRRSFGENRENVADKGIAYMLGMQEAGIIACAKHFPGHGDTDADSHKVLPVILHNRSRLDSIELYPFTRLIEHGLAATMVAHLYVPTLDSVSNRATTLSPLVVDGLLKTDLGFKGLVFSDALNMREVSGFYNPGMVDVKALLAGNDILLFVKDVPTAIIEIKKSVKRGELSEAEIDKRCRKLLLAKEWSGLNEYKPVELNNLTQDLNLDRAKAVKFKLIRDALTVLKNDNDLIPLSGLDTSRIAVLSIGEGLNNPFQVGLSRYAKITSFSCDLLPSKARQAELLDSLSAFTQVIVSIHTEEKNPFLNFGVSKQAVKLVSTLAQRQPVVLDLFANPYSLRRFNGIQDVQAVIVSYENDAMVQDISSQLIFGGVSAKGKLPITASGLFPAGSGLETGAPVRFAYSFPEVLGINSADLDGVARIANQGILDKAYPGCQILVAKEGQVIYQKTFGHHTYEKKQVVRNSDIYDLASITKIAASTASMMRLSGDSIISIDNTLGDYLLDWVDSTKYAKINIRAMMAHQAGLVSWIPFYTKTLTKGEPIGPLYSTTQNEIYNCRVAENLYMNCSYHDTMIQRLVATELSARKKYLYSDLGYYFLMEIIKRKSGKAIDQFAFETFYNPMGLQTMSYMPRERHTLNEIVPTEYDMSFRKQLVHGDVHDPGSAMMGGVGGHAGLFSNSNDLAIMMQMMVNDGKYGGVQYLDSATVKHFTSSHFLSNNNRRGVGFDKPVRGDGGPTCRCVSYDSFGHSGFTGTITWADPEKDVVYVFLSNRIYPDAGNRKLISGGMRTRIQQVIYNAINNADAGS